MKVVLTNEKPMCRTCIHSSPVRVSSDDLFCNKKRNIVEPGYRCRKYKFDIEKSAEKRIHFHDFDKLGLDKIEIS